ncbi:hypothetical protein J6590_064630 [Homalodisca vitripennis]|nr:hypothetical protein J6590_064630 [Homalodisca vitripennis]
MVRIADMINRSNNTMYYIANDEMFSIQLGATCITKVVNFRFQEEDTLFVRRKPMSRLRQQQSGELPLVMTQGRRVRNSLQRLEQQQDEMFEL